MPTDLFRTLDIRNRRAFSLAGRDGKAYRLRLIETVQEFEKSLQNVLPSNYISTIGATNYGIALRAYAIEFAKIKIALEDIQADGYISSEAYASQRADILYQKLGSLLAIERDLNLTIFSSQEFYNFLLALIEIFFGGSTPANIKKGIEQFVNEEDVAEVLENFLDARNPTSAFDISDQFGFRINFELTDNIAANFTDIGIKLDFLIRLIKPAHTLYQLRFIFTDLVEFIRTADDSFYRPGIWDHAYDDARVYCDGVEGRDRMGHNAVREVTDEDHTGMAGTVIYTLFGPLSKNQTIPELADTSDVVVLVNSAPVAVASVSAAEGIINLAAPVIATDTVEVSYFWWRRAEFQLLLNTKGQTFADPHFAHSKFQAFWVLNDVVPKTPREVIWHYSAYERAYTAALNDPSSLILNEPNHKIRDPVTGRLYGSALNWENKWQPVRKHVLNWANYVRSHEQVAAVPPVHVLNEGTPIIELKEAAAPTFEYYQPFDVPDDQGWGEMPWGDNPLGWGGPSMSFGLEAEYGYWKVTVPGGTFIAPVSTSVEETGTTGLLSIACEEDGAATLSRFQDEFEFETFCGESLFIFNVSNFNGLDVLGPAENACLVYFTASVTAPADTSTVPSSATDDLHAASVGGEEDYSELFNFSGFFIFNQSNVNDTNQVLHDTVLQEHWNDEGNITMQFDAGPILTLPAHERDFV
jgi:hypothetical protein